MVSEDCLQARAPDIYSGSSVGHATFLGGGVGLEEEAVDSQGAVGRENTASG